MTSLEKGRIFEFNHSKNYEPIIGCKHPIIASEATPIGSVEHTPDKENIM
jgi:hypothetical protein